MMNTDTLNSLGVTYNEIEEVQSNVIAIMEKLGMKVYLTKLPEIKVNYLLPQGQADYNIDNHVISINPFKLPKAVIKMLLAHELTHSLQGLTNEIFYQKYSDRKCEHEAYAVQDAYSFMLTKPTKWLWFKLMNPKKAGRFLERVARRIESKEAYTSHKDRYDEIKRKQRIEDQLKITLDLKLPF